MTKEFEWLLKSEGWEKIQKPCTCSKCSKPDNVARLNDYWRGPGGVEDIDPPESTYEFISKIKIKDWGKYIKEISQIIEKTGKKASSHTGYFKAFHNASLEHRILALARERGYKS